MLRTLSDRKLIKRETDLTHVNVLQEVNYRFEDFATGVEICSNT